MLGLTPKQAQVLEVIIQQTRESGCPPTETRIKEVMQLTSVWRMLDAMREKGYLAQPFKAGAWVPLMTPEGCPLRLHLVEGDEPVLSSPKWPSDPRDQLRAVRSVIARHGIMSLAELCNVFPSAPKAQLQYVAALLAEVALVALPEPAET